MQNFSVFEKSGLNHGRNLTLNSVTFLSSVYQIIEEQIKVIENRSVEVLPHSTEIKQECKKCRSHIEKVTLQS